jgi:hypothetical protein
MHFERFHKENSQGRSLGSKPGKIGEKENDRNTSDTQEVGARGSKWGSLSPVLILSRLSFESVLIFPRQVVISPGKTFNLNMMATGLGWLYNPVLILYIITQKETIGLGWLFFFPP